MAAGLYQQRFNWVLTLFFSVYFPVALLLRSGDLSRGKAGWVSLSTALLAWPVFAGLALAARLKWLAFPDQAIPWLLLFASLQVGALAFGLYSRSDPRGRIGLRIAAVSTLVLVIAGCARLL